MYKRVSKPVHNFSQERRMSEDTKGGVDHQSREAMHSQVAKPVDPKQQHNVLFESF